jgi:2-polyprenyl-3-methyl-5-hydroxy-6-metoxy-1,4-benzoquinol methylase
VDKFCPVCNTQLTKGLQSWHWKCPTCKYECADLAPAINQSDAHEKVDEDYRERGLKSLRVDNFNKLLDSITRCGKQSGNVLDVGCAHGWFLEAAQKRGFQTLGIEPDLCVYKGTSARGLPARLGFFPQALSPDEKFDVIVFNDVFEHIADLNAVLIGCKDHLKPGGLLVLNLPSSNGVFYKMACILSRFGINQFFERVWQKGMPSPHLHYFNPTNLNKLLKGNSFTELATGNLSTLRLKGLYTRISYTGNYSLPVRAVIYIAVAVSLPLIDLFQSDIIYTIAKNQLES